jgi:hypothetical protein
MQRFFTTLLALTFGCCALTAQEPCKNIFPTDADGHIIYQKEVRVQGRADKFATAKTWAANAFRNQKDALQVEDKKTGLLMYRTYLTVPITIPGSPTQTDYYYWMNVTIKSTLTNSIEIKIDHVSLGNDNGDAGGDVLKISERYASVKDGKFLKKLYPKITSNCDEANRKIIALLRNFENYLTTYRN